MPATAASSKRRERDVGGSPSRESSDRDEEELEIEGVAHHNINPYKVLGIEAEASAEDVRKAYRKMALANHPDKVDPTKKNDAHHIFQEIAFAYAILSDERRRKRYDLTGRTSEILEGEDEADDFNWLDFYRAQFSEAVTEDRINNIAKEYKGSEEERQHILAAYTQYNGKLDKIYDNVMLSDILEDDDRFRQIIQEEIDKGTVQAYSAFKKITDASREKKKEEERKRRAKFDEHQLEKTIKQGNKGKFKPKNHSGKKDDLSGLAALIQSRQQARSGNIFAHLEEKYAGKGKGRAAMPADEPPEELFQKNAEKMKGARADKSMMRESVTPGEMDEFVEDDEDNLGEEEEHAVTGGKRKRRGSKSGRGNRKAARAAGPSR
ncbi:DnaJ-domain-containing protein [Delitschia confertaspora ATCC 74209]|uniref:DnaJ-domain-containing protein n=1 Tax=Delitschia confertaspora ATCC 74209 TaxID=1513339 RepID=A0A9P4JS48_9PLEO|nr:DnaJ-domain-containing protein [Delitschia confertaspora ATCC 74209]